MILPLTYVSNTIVSELLPIQRQHPKVANLACPPIPQGNFSSLIPFQEILRLAKLTKMRTGQIHFDVDQILKLRVGGSTFKYYVPPRLPCSIITIYTSVANGLSRGK